MTVLLTRPILTRRRLEHDLTGKRGPTFPDHAQNLKFEGRSRPKEDSRPNSWNSLLAAGSDGRLGPRTANRRPDQENATNGHQQAERNKSRDDGFGPRGREENQRTHAR